MAFKENFQIPGRFRLISIILMVVGLLSILTLYITHGSSSDHREQARFWSSLLQNSVYFLLVTNAAMFFIGATILAWAGFTISFRRVAEAISACVPVLAVISGVILLAICFSDNHTIYHWTDTHHVAEDPILDHKKGFLNKTFFATWTIITLVLWSVLGWKLRKLSRESDNKKFTVQEGKAYIWKNTIWAAVYIAFFGLTVMSSIPWLWLMSIDAHWYSTMYSWYTFASSFVAGIALITLFVVYLKNRGYLELTSEEHIHDLGKFMFAFSVFWTYLWFSQYMLIWYANIPEETVYFEPRQQGPYRGLFLLNLIINFLAPLLLLMKRDAKRNYGTVTILAVLIIFGHWLDFYQMVFPGPLKDPATSDTYVPMMLLDFGVALGFVGLIMFLTGRALTKAPLIPKGHPFIKESIIHHT